MWENRHPDNGFNFLEGEGSAVGNNMLDPLGSVEGEVPVRPLYGPWVITTRIP